MTARKEEYKEQYRVGNVGRGSFTAAEIAERNSVSLSVVYRALKAGRLKASNLGGGAQRSTVRISAKQESDWLDRCEDEQGADEQGGGDEIKN